MTSVTCHRCMSTIEPKNIAVEHSLRKNGRMSLAGKTGASLLLVGCLATATLAVGQSTSDEKRTRETRIVALEHLWNEAQVNRDSSALAGMIGDKFVNTEWDGEVSDRGQFLADIANPQFKPTALNIQDVKVILYKDTAVVTGIYHTKGSYQGRPTITPDDSRTPGCSKIRIGSVWQAIPASCQSSALYFLSP